MPESHDTGKRCVEEIAREVAQMLGLTSIRFEWGGEEESLRFPLRITTDQGVTEPAIRFGISELDWSCNPANEAYHEVKRRLTTALQLFCSSPKRIGFR